MICFDFSLGLCGCDVSEMFSIIMSILKMLSFGFLPFVEVATCVVLHIDLGISFMSDALSDTICPFLSTFGTITMSGQSRVNVALSEDY